MVYAFDTFLKTSLAPEVRIMSTLMAVFIGMVPEGQIPICFFDISFGGTLRNPQDLVIILFVLIRFDIFLHLLLFLICHNWF